MIVKNEPSDWRSDDEVMKEIRRTRETYAARFDYDLGALFRHAQEVTEREKQKGRKVVRRNPKPVDELAAVPE